MGLIYLGTCLLIDAFENHPAWAPRVRKAMTRAHRKRFAISHLITMECLVSPLKAGNFLLQRRYDEGLRAFEQLPLPEPVFLQAASARPLWTQDARCPTSGLRTASRLRSAMDQR
jgi:uncharacterized protein